MRNPFSAGSWVSGEQFFGRENIIEKLLHSNESCDWVLAQRRMGKTSLLRCLEERINNNQKDLPAERPNTSRPGPPGKGLAIFWDIQGSYDVSGLIESLEDAMDDSFDMFPEAWGDMDPSEFQAEHAHQMIKALSRRLRRCSLNLTLLIDEAEEFIPLNDKNPEALSRLRKVFHTCSNLHTIICSTPRLSKLMQNDNLETSPFLHGFHSHYLGSFSSKETQQLLVSGEIEQETGAKIFEKTLGNPYQVQLFGKYFFENREFVETDHFMQSNPSLAQVHEVNFGLLNKEEQELLTKVKISSSPYQPDQQEAVELQKLVYLGYVINVDQAFSIASSFFEDWLGKHFNLHMNLHPKDEADVPFRDASSKRIRQNIVNLYKYLLQQLEHGKRLEINPDHFKVSGFDRKVFPIHDESSSLPIQLAGTPSWRIAAVDLVELLGQVLNFENNWSVYRLKEMVENLSGCEESDILDLMMLIREEARLEAD